MAAPDASEEGFVKRSRGHIVVASWLVAAGLLSVGSGILGAAPASAEPGGRPGVQSGASRPGDSSKQGFMSSQAGLGRQQPSGRTRVSATGGDNPARLATPARRTLPAPKLGMPADRVPTILVSDTATTTFGEQPEAAETAADTVPPAAVPASVSPAAAAVEPVLAPVVRPVSSPADAVAPEPNRNRPIALTPRSLRLGLPANVSDAALPQFDPLVVPGLVTLLGLTAIGAFMGYRQAKPGLFPTSARTRFLQ